MVQYMYANYHWPCYLEFTHILKKCKQPFSVPHALHAALVLVHGTAKGVAQSRAAVDDGAVKRSPPECCAILSRSDGHFKLHSCLIPNCHSHSRVVVCRYVFFGIHATKRQSLAGAFAIQYRSFPNAHVHMFCQQAAGRSGNCATENTE